MAFDYEVLLKETEDRLEILYQHKGAVESEIASLEQLIRDFGPLVGRPTLWIGPEAGITKAVAEVLKGSPALCWTATALRDELLERGMELNQKNPLATIHQVFARLVERKDAEIVPINGRNLYKWNTEKTLEKGSRKGTKKAME